MEEIFVSKYLNNLSITEKEKRYVMKNTVIEVQIIDPVRGNDALCKGGVTEDLN